MYKIDDHYSIEVLSGQELENLVELTLAHIDESPYKGADPDKEYLIEFFSHFIGVHKDKLALLLRHVSAGVVGYIIVVQSQHPMWHKLKSACELGWWVHADHRSNGAGVNLIKAAEEWAKFAGIEKLSLSNLNNSYMERLDALYNKLGYVMVEKSFVKDIV